MKKVNFFQLRRQKRAKVFHRRRRIADASWASKNTHYRAMMGHREVGEVIKASHLLNEKRFALSLLWRRAAEATITWNLQFLISLSHCRPSSSVGWSFFYFFRLFGVIFTLFRCLLFLSALLVARQSHFHSHRKAEKSRRRASTKKKHTFLVSGKFRCKSSEIHFLGSREKGNKVGSCLGSLSPISLFAHNIANFVCLFSLGW